MSDMQNVFQYRDGQLFWKNDRGRNKVKGKRAGGYSGKKGYRYVSTDQGRISEHRAVWIYHNGPIPKNMEIHHINGVRDDNRIENLEMVTHQQNLQLKEAKGYYKRGDRYYAVIKADGSGPRWLGSYETPEEARAAYLKAKKELHRV